MIQPTPTLAAQIANLRLGPAMASVATQQDPCLVSYAGPSKLLDGTIDPQSPVSSGQIALSARGLPPGGTVNFTLSAGAASVTIALTLDQTGAGSQVATITDPTILAAYDSLGSGTWSDVGSLWAAASASCSITASVA